MQIVYLDLNESNYATPLKVIVKRSKYRLVWRNLIFGKNAVFIKTENEFKKKSDFCYTWSNGHNQQVFQISERSDEYFTQKWNFYIRVNILISCPSFSRVLHNSTQKHRKIRHFSRDIWIMILYLHILILRCLTKELARIHGKSAH